MPVAAKAARRSRFSSLRAFTSLKRQHEFARIYRRGRRNNQAHFVVYHYKRRPGPTVRIGIAIGKPVGNAVHRNLVRRRIQCTLDTLDLHAFCDLDIVIVAKPGVAELEYGVMRGQIVSAVEQIPHGS